MDLTTKIKDRAYQLGFDLVGISAAKPSQTVDFYSSWLTRGYAGEMSYLERHREKKIDPRRLLPQTRSVISLGINYFTNDIPIKNYELRITNYELQNWKGILTPTNFENYELTNVEDATSSPPDEPNQKGAPWLGVAPNTKSKGGLGGKGLSPQNRDEKQHDASLGFISRYAWGDDYHNIIHRKLKKLLNFIKSEAGKEVQGRGFVDTAPILEREMAYNAHIGWFGKNTNIINYEIGSWFFLSEILVDIELEYDEMPAKGSCGTCTRCIEACPTGALIAPYTLDARRCISYLTIEFKGSIPVELRPLLRNRIFGCDVCQEVCPWNRKAKPTNEPAFLTRINNIAPELLSLINLNDVEFRAKFKNSPIKRAKRRGFLRNVAVALGNWGNDRAVPALSRALQDEEPLIQEHAAWALEQINSDARS